MTQVVWLVQGALFILQLVILADVLMSWVRPDPYNPIVRFIREVSGTVLDPIRRFVPPIGGLDLTPIIALFLLQLLAGLLR